MSVKAQHQILAKEFLNWTLVIIIVGMLSLLFGRVATGALPNQVDGLPALLPSEIEDWGSPARSTDVVSNAIDPPADNDARLLSELWATMDLHRSGEMDEAILGWQRITLPLDSEVWSAIGLAAAYLRVGDLADATDVLDHAAGIDVDNPLVHYLRAIVLLTEAQEAPEWYDAIDTPATRLVGHIPQKFTRTSSLYELAAMSEFELAIEFASSVDLDQYLLPPVVFAGVHDIDPIGSGIMHAVLPETSDVPQYQRSDEISLRLDSPTVGDLLEAIGADNFEGKAHNVLGPLYMDRGSLEQAEEHMDAAVALEMNVLDGYEQLSDRYQTRGDYGSALRASLKAIGRNGRVLGPTKQAVENLLKALRD